MSGTARRDARGHVFPVRARWPARTSPAQPIGRPQHLLPRPRTLIARPNSPAHARSWPRRGASHPPARFAPTSSSTCICAPCPAAAPQLVAHAHTVTCYCLALADLAAPSTFLLFSFTVRTSPRRSHSLDAASSQSSQVACLSLTAECRAVARAVARPRSARRFTPVHHLARRFSPVASRFSPGELRAIPVAGSLLLAPRCPLRDSALLSPLRSPLPSPLFSLSWHDIVSG